MVHVSIVVLLTGSSIGSFGGYIAQELVPRGEIVHIQNLTKFGSLSSIPQNISCRINDFWITYTKEQKTDQFYSDLSVINEEGKELKRKIVFVNEPLIFNELVIYQTDWDIVGLKIRLPDESVFQVPFKKVTKNGSKFWLGSIPINKETGKKLSILKNNLNDTISIYDEKGILLQESTIGDSILIEDGIKLQFVEFITSTGLQIKSDPGIFTVYLSFLLLMVSIYVSFFTYSQIWLVETIKDIAIGGQSNRAVLFFQEEFRKIWKRTIKTVS
jgi:cytochrome c biogenesis protein